MILFYAVGNSSVVENLSKLLAVHPVKRCRSFDAMIRCLKKPRHGLEIALLAVSGVGEMARIIEIRDLMRDLRLVLVLPERDDQTVAWAHKLAPRFIAFADNGYAQVGAVLDKMIRSGRPDSLSRPYHIMNEVPKRSQ